MRMLSVGYLIHLGALDPRRGKQCTNLVPETPPLSQSRGLPSGPVLDLRKKLERQSNDQQEFSR